MRMKTRDDDVAVEEMLPEYDFSKGVRGKYAGIFHSFPDQTPSAVPYKPDRAEFHERAGKILGEYYGVELEPREMPHVHRCFDLVSLDEKVVGDAHYYARTSSANLATISEYVWLLEKTDAPSKFLVFGNDPRVPIRWLNAHGHLLTAIAFYFLRDDNRLIHLTGPRMGVIR